MYFRKTDVALFELKVLNFSHALFLILFCLDFINKMLKIVIVKIEVLVVVQLQKMVEDRSLKYSRAAVVA